VGPGVWVHGRVLVGGPLFENEAGYRGREATIDGPLALTFECVGGDDLYSPTRCFLPPVKIKYGPMAFYPVCSLHSLAPVHVVVDGYYEMADFLDAAAILAATLGTFIAGSDPV